MPGGARPMHFLQITDLGDGHVQVSWQREASVPRAYRESIPFADPLTEKDRAELCWHPEEYLLFPCGAERDRAGKVKVQMGGPVSPRQRGKHVIGIALGMLGKRVSGRNSALGGPRE